MKTDQEKGRKLLKLKKYEEALFFMRRAVKNYISEKGDLSDDTLRA